MIKLWNPPLASTCNRFCGTNFSYSHATSIKTILWFLVLIPSPCRTMPFDQCVQLLCLWHRPFLRSSFVFVSMAADKIRCGTWLMLVGLHVGNLWDVFCKHIVKEITVTEIERGTFFFPLGISDFCFQTQNTLKPKSKALWGLLTLLHTCS